MSQPRLIILQEVGGIPTLGGCSCCPLTILATGKPPIGVAQEHLEYLERMFRSHLKAEHIHEAVACTHQD